MKMLPDEHEYKVMGLAPYNDDRPKIAQVEKVFQSMQSLDGLEFRFNPSIKNIFSYLEENLRQFRFDQIAAGLQSFTEKFLNMGLKQLFFLEVFL
jgi:carbamoyltransferase